MAKFAFIGAGSFGFTRGLVRDLLTFKAFQNSTFALMDIDQNRLNFIEKSIQQIIEAGQYSAKVYTTTNRKDALKGADGVICTILQGGVHVFKYDIEIPKKYGVDINVGDTRGPAGVFRAFRTIPIMIDICHDIEKYCPKAVFLNYTNPMAMLCRAMQKKTKVNVIGLCHSVQGTAEMLAHWIKAPVKEIEYLCAGINHQAWFLEYKWNGKDAYPLIKETVLKDKKIYNEEIVRNEMFLHLGYYVTESSGHNSEYNAWFRKRPDLIKKYCLKGTGWNPGAYAFIRDEYLKRDKAWNKKKVDKELNEPISLQRGNEYAAYIFNALFGDNKEFEFNGNISNDGLIDNLPDGACVEVPIRVSKTGFQPQKIGALPKQLALLNSICSQCEELAVEGILERNTDKLFYSIAYDPLTSAVLSLDEIKKMTDEMLRVNKENKGSDPQFPIQ